MWANWREGIVTELENDILKWYQANKENERQEMESEKQPF